MADIKISDLATSSDASNNDLIPIVDVETNTTKKISKSDFMKDGYSTNTISRTVLEPQIWGMAMYSGLPQTGQILVVSTEHVFEFDMLDPNSNEITLDTGTRSLVVHRAGFYQMNFNAMPEDGGDEPIFICWLEVAIDNNNHFIRFRQFDRHIYGVQPSLSNSNFIGQTYSIAYWLPAGAKVRVTGYVGTRNMRFAACDSGLITGMSDTDMKRYCGTNLSLALVG